MSVSLRTLKYVQNRHFVKIFACVCGAVCVVVLLVGGVLWARSAYIESTYVPVTAVITARNEAPNIFDTQIEVTFSLDGKTHTAVRKENAYWMVPGAQAELLCSPDNPEKVFFAKGLGSTASIWLNGGLWAGVLFLFLLVLFLFFRSREQQAAAEESDLFIRNNPAQLLKKDTCADMLNVLKNSDFILPRDEMLLAERKRLIQIALGTLGLSTALSIAWFFFLFLPRHVPFTISDAIMMLCIVLVFCFPVLFLYLPRHLLYTPKVPARIQLRDDALQIDDASFAIEDIRLIRMTPIDDSSAAYSPKGGTSSRRHLEISLRKGMRHYYIGNIPSMEDALVYKDYDRLFQALYNWCATCHIVFTCDY